MNILYVIGMFFWSFLFFSGFKTKVITSCTHVFNLFMKEFNVDLVKKRIK